MTEDPTKRYVTKKGKSLHVKACHILNQNDLIEASGDQLKYNSCGKCLKHEKKVNAREASLQRPATTYAAQWSKPNRLSPRTIILFGDTEGNQYCSELSVMSLDDLYYARFDITIPKEYKTKKVTGSIGIDQAFLRIAEDLKEKVETKHEVLFLFHNGAQHDFPLIRSTVPKDFKFPEHFRFGDTISVLSNVVNGFESKWSQKFVYETLFGEVLQYRKTESLKVHTADYDAQQLRRIFRFLARWLFGSRVLLVGLMEARSKLSPDMPCGDAIPMLESFIVHLNESKKIEGYGFATLTPLTSLNASLAIYAAPKSTKAHIKECSYVKKSNLPIEKDKVRLQGLPLCQKCPFPLPNPVAHKL